MLTPLCVSCAYAIRVDVIAVHPSGQVDTSVRYDCERRFIEGTAGCRNSCHL